VSGSRLELQCNKGGISLLAPPRLTARFQSLPPMLHISDRNSLLGCSEGARGLSVLQRATGVFTGASTSLSGLPRQRSHRYSIHAGRNLPDKEFRYLRTVIVTAAVYRGFGSELRPDCSGLTPLLNLPAPGRSQALYVRLTFAEPCVFGKQSREPFHCDPLGLRPRRTTPQRAPLIPKLRGYFAEFLGKLKLTRLRIFSLSTCVGLRYGRLQNSRRSFSRRHGIGRLVCPKTHFPASLGVYDLPGFPGRSPYVSGRALPVARGPILPRPSGRSITFCKRRGNVDPLPIAYAFRPGLRDRLTLNGRALFRKP
jgi:hypothetical protein